MKNLIKHIIVGILISGLPLALTATVEKRVSNANYDLPVYNVAGIDTLPVPIVRTIPTIQSGFVGTTIMMKVTVDEFGIPSRVHSARPLFSLGTVNEKERDFAVQMSNYISYWDFEPATDLNGNPIEVTVNMPVTVIERDGVQSARVAIILENNFSTRHG
jgi:hypothetical protein